MEYSNAIVEQATAFGRICGTPFYGMRTQIDHTYREAFPTGTNLQVKADLTDLGGEVTPFFNRASCCPPASPAWISN